VTNGPHVVINHDRHDSQGGEEGPSPSDVMLLICERYPLLYWLLLLPIFRLSSRMSLPLDVLYIIAELSPLSTRAALSQCNWTLHLLCNVLLYLQNDRLHSPSIALDIIQHSSDITAAVSALCKAHAAGADLNAHKPMRVVDISKISTFKTSPAPSAPIPSLR
jgi:hypothetical protein